MDWNTKSERRERKKKNNLKMRVDGKDLGEFYKRAIEKRKKNRPKRRRTDDV